MASKQTVNIDKEQVQIDPNLLFQRLASIASQSPDTLENALEYELSSYPPSLFDSTFFMREAQKSQLTDCILNLTKESSFTLTDNVQNVLDGGSLLHKIPWVKNMSFGAIIQNYVNYVLKNFGLLIIVFDGYESSTKDMAHQRRQKNKQSIRMNFNEDSQLCVSKEVFLSNEKNKECFIKMQGKALHLSGSIVHFCSGDADLTICLTAVESAKSWPTVVYGEDTDLLVLLLHHSKTEDKEIFSIHITNLGINDLFPPIP